MYILYAISVFDRFVVAMRNGELDSKGALASIIQSEGTIESFKVRFLPIM
jgi:ABC-type enterochelin transport system ATPase subunit